MGRSFDNRKVAMAKTAGMKIKLYTKFGRELYVAAKSGSTDPDSNPTLRRVLERAKKAQVPSHIIDNAMKKAKGVGGEDFTSARYEGYGPGGTMLIIDCLTDNNNRTISDLRNCFNKCDCKIAGPGSVAHMFDHVALFAFKFDDENAVLEAMMEADVDVKDIQNESGIISVLAPPNDYTKAKAALVEKFPKVELEIDEVTFEPQTTSAISGDDAARFEKLLAMINELDDVQEVYHNAELPSE